MNEVENDIESEFFGGIGQSPVSPIPRVSPGPRIGLVPRDAIANRRCAGVDGKLEIPETAIGVTGEAVFIELTATSKRCADDGVLDPNGPDERCVEGAAHLIPVVAIPRTK